MEGSAHEENKIVQFTGQHTRKLHNTVVNRSTQAGYPVTVTEVDPDDRSALENIRQTVETITKDPVRVAGGMIEERVGGESRTTHVGTTGGKEPVSMWLKRRILKKAA